MDLLPNIEINLGDSIPFLWEKFSKLIGKDAETHDLRMWFSRLQEIAMIDASTVQCIGMHTPLPIGEIYRPTKLRWKSTTTAPIRGEKRVIKLPTGPITSTNLLSTPTNAAIFAGPGYGKTTLLHHIYLTKAFSDVITPILITLRRGGAVDDLCKLVDFLLPIQKAGNTEILLLVDGYDEVSIAERKKVSQKLLTFSASGFGRFYLTCREFYDIYDLKIPQVYVSPFDEADQELYMAAFAKAYGSTIRVKETLVELRARGLQDILSHPLLLAMVCIIKSGTMTLQSNSVLMLMERAIDTLAFRWDEGRGVSREQVTSVDGRSRIHCLMRIAFSAKTTQVEERVVLARAREQLDLLRWADLDERQVMLETARFYGILVPLEESAWQFVHRTLHDYLAARFWIEKGFSASSVKEWDARAAYAACLSMDATKSMLAALSKKETISAFVEMLSNDAPFEHPVIANALVAHYQQFAEHHLYTRDEKDRGGLHISVMLAVDYVSSASNKFLLDLSLCCVSGHPNKAKDTLFAYAVLELGTRDAKLTKTVYSHACRLFGANCRFTVNKYGMWRSVELSQLIPSDDIDEND